MNTTLPKHKRDERIVESYLEGEELEQIAKEAKVDVPRVRQILRGFGYKPSERKKRKACQASRKSPKSGVHERLGRWLYDYRHDHNISPYKAANDLEISLVRLNLIEQGVSALELLELQDIASYIKVDVDQVMKGYHA